MIITEGDRVRVLNATWLNDAEGYAHPEHRLSTAKTCVVFFPGRAKYDDTFNIHRSQLTVVADTRPQREPEPIFVGPHVQLNLQDAEEAILFDDESDAKKYVAQSSYHDLLQIIEGRYIQDAGIVGHDQPKESA
jgi:hypothetical protein